MLISGLQESMRVARKILALHGNPRYQCGPEGRDSGMYTKAGSAEHEWAMSESTPTKKAQILASEYRSKQTEQASNQILWALVEAPLSIIRPQYKICPKVAYYTAIIIGYKKWNKPILARQQTRTLVWDDSIIILCLSVQTHLQYNHWCKMKAHLCPNFISSRDERWFRQHLKSSIKLDCPRLSFQSVSNSA